MKRGWILAGALLLLIVAFALKGQLAAAPDQQLERGGFDAVRAMARLERILGPGEPHPVDSAANDAVRERIVAELRALGIEPRVSDDFACNSVRRNRAVSCARVRNLVATIGAAGGRHVLAAAHYDSSPVGPGAADDGIGIAVLLETAALLREQPLARPVTLLITEGEEVGLLGARAFVERDPLAAQVEALVNLEARGVEGPAVMFETSRPNGAAIAHFSRAVDRPVANSLNSDFYRLIPNSTDVAVFEERGWTTLNFAIIGNETRYHSAGDTLAALEPRSVQHMGEQALAVIADMAGGRPSGAEGERHYMDLVGRQLIVLPAPVSLALLGLLLLLFGWTAWRRRNGAGIAAAALFAGLADAAILAWVGQA
ncbi:MAG: M20/M25/M40 family metallo-hydrolase, partial [Pseudomonadota bacterium]|nr:M20/M25/M40 family metallo-hydrolase [Pseudomonadota bacterium]